MNVHILPFDNFCEEYFLSMFIFLVRKKRAVLVYKISVWRGQNFKLN